MKPFIRIIITFPSGKQMKKDYDDRKEFLGQMSEVYDILRSDDHYLLIARGMQISNRKPEAKE